MSCEGFIKYRKELEAVADNEQLTHDERIVALCKLYTLYQHDVHNQAKVVRRIETIAEQKENDRPQKVV